MPLALRKAALSQLVLWPDDASVQTLATLSERDAADLHAALKLVRASKQSDGYPEFYRRLGALHKTVRRGVQFVTQPVGSDVFISSLDADTGGAAVLLRVSSAGAHVKYRHGGREVAVGPDRVCAISEIVAPAGVRTRSDAAISGVELLTRPEVEAAELTRWREELRLSREAERDAIARAETAEAASEKAIAAETEAKAQMTTSRQYCALLENKLATAEKALETKEDESAQERRAEQDAHETKQRELREQIKELKCELNDTRAKMFRSQSSRVEVELDAAAQIQDAEARARSTLDELKRQMRCAVDDAKAGTIDHFRTLSGLAEVLCPESNITSVTSIDSLAESSAALDEKSRRRHDYARVTSELCCGVFNFAAGGDSSRVDQLVRDVPQQRSWQRLLQGSCSTDDDYERRRTRHNELVVDNVVGAWRIGKALGNYRLSKQMLSLLVTGKSRGGIYQYELAQAATRRRELGLLDEVLVLHRYSHGSGRSWRSGVLSSMSADASSGGTVYSVIPRERTKRERKTVDVGMLPVSVLEIRHSDDPYCTIAAVKGAGRHALAFYPGAPAPAIINNLPRTVGKRAEHCAIFLRSVDAVARPDGGLNTAKKGVKYLLKEKPAALLRNLNQILKAKGEKPYPWKHFYQLVAPRRVLISSLALDIHHPPSLRARQSPFAVALPPAAVAHGDNKPLMRGCGVCYQFRAVFDRPRGGAHRIDTCPLRLRHHRCPLTSPLPSDIILSHCLYGLAEGIRGSEDEHMLLCELSRPRLFCVRFAARIGRSAEAGCDKWSPVVVR